MTMPFSSEDKAAWRDDKTILPDAEAAFASWTLVHLHKVKQSFQTVQIPTGAGHARRDFVADYFCALPEKI